MQGYWIPYNTVTGEVGPSVNDRDLVTKWLRDTAELGTETSALAVQCYTVTDDPLAPRIATRVSDISYDDWMATKAPPEPEEPPADEGEADDEPPESPADNEVPV